MGPNLCRLLAGVILVIAIGWGTSRADEPILNVGDQAPPLKFSRWVKGTAINKLEPGRTYVLEFWATWCGPCRATIPHLTELAHQYKTKNVRFVGVDVWENDPQRVESFIEEMGEKMDYAVAIDSSDTVMAKAWLTAAEEHGIPTAFIIHDRKIAWIGHPMGMDSPLSRVTSGQFDATAEAKHRLATKLAERKERQLGEKLAGLYRARKYKETVAAIDEAAGEDTQLGERFVSLKLAALCYGGDVEAGLALGQRLLQADANNALKLKNDFRSLNDASSTNSPDLRVNQMAVKAAQRIVELSRERDPMSLDTLAAALFRAGDVAGAITAQEKAIKLLVDQGKDPSDPFMKFLNSHLDRYRASGAKPKTGATGSKTSSAAPSTNGFVGEWCNKDFSTPGITRVHIRTVDDRLTVHMWGRCHPKECDWGEAAATKSSQGLSVKWDHGFAVKTQELRILANGDLQVDTRARFTDGSGRRDYDASDTFAKGLVHDWSDPPKSTNSQAAAGKRPKTIGN
jgi:thiol-disulfide isomerase/thioredoxin